MATDTEALALVESVARQLDGAGHKAADINEWITAAMSAENVEQLALFALDALGSNPLGRCPLSLPNGQPE